MSSVRQNMALTGVKFPGNINRQLSGLSFSFCYREIRQNPATSSCCAHNFFKVGSNIISSNSFSTLSYMPLTMPLYPCVLNKRQQGCAKTSRSESINRTGGKTNLGKPLVCCLGLKSYLLHLLWGCEGLDHHVLELHLVLQHTDALQQVLLLALELLVQVPHLSIHLGTGSQAQAGALEQVGARRESSGTQQLNIKALTGGCKEPPGRQLNTVRGSYFSHTIHIPLLLRAPCSPDTSHIGAFGPKAHV